MKICMDCAKEIQDATRAFRHCRAFPLQSATRNELAEPVERRRGIP